MDLIKFKKVKVGTAPDESIDISRPLTMLELQRLPYAKNKLKNRKREKDTLDKLEKFKEHLRSKEVKEDEDNWMNNRLKFHIDSERAYGLQKAYNESISNTQISKLQGIEQHAQNEPQTQKKDIDISEIIKQIK